MRPCRGQRADTRSGRPKHGCPSANKGAKRPEELPEAATLDGKLQAGGSLTFAPPVGNAHEEGAVDGAQRTITDLHKGLAGRVRCDGHAKGGAQASRTAGRTSTSQSGLRKKKKNIQGATRRLSWWHSRVRTSD